MCLKESFCPFTWDALNFHCDQASRRLKIHGQASRTFFLVCASNRPGSVQNGCKAVMTAFPLLLIFSIYSCSL